MGIGIGLLLASNGGLAAATAQGAAKALKAPPSKAVWQQYLKELSLGRAADGKQQLAEARKHFEAAVALLPEGGAAQSELGWAAYRQKDLNAAETATRAALRVSAQPGGATPDAVKQAACRAQLEQVITKQADPNAPLQRADLEAPDPNYFNCEQQDVRLPSGGPLKKVLVVSAGVTFNHYRLSTIGLWVQTEKGWFQQLVDTAERWKWEGASVACKSAQAVGSLVEVRVPTGL